MLYAWRNEQYTVDREPKRWRPFGGQTQTEEMN
jgi:hypothetical protein